MSKRLLLALLLLTSTAFATTTVSGNIKDLTGTAVSSNTFVRFYLRGCSGNQPRINGTALIAPTFGNVYYKDFVPNASGVISGTLYSTRDAAGTGNGEIECGGVFTGVWYGMVAFQNGKAGPETPVHAKNGVTLDISNVTALSTNPVVTAPAGDTTYLRLDGTNSPATGAITFNGTTTFAGAITDAVGQLIGFQRSGAPPNLVDVGISHCSGAGTLCIGNGTAADGSGSLTAGAGTFSGPSPWIDVTHPTYGAGTGLSNNATAFQAAITAATTNGGTVFVPCGTYAFTAAISMASNVTLKGEQRGCTHLKFTGATDGIDIADGVQNWGIDNIDLETSNAAGTKAIFANGSVSGITHFYISNTSITQTGTGRWTHGLYCSFCEVSLVTNLKIFQSATIGIYLINSSNQLVLVNPEITGGQASDLTFNRGIWVDTPGTDGPDFFGATSQGCFSLGSAIFVSGHNGRWYGTHAEGTCAATDGGDLVISGASENQFFGGQIVQQTVLTGTIRGFLADGINMQGAVTFGASVQGACLRDGRAASITDNGTVGSSTDNGNCWTNMRSSAGGLYRDKGAVEKDNGSSSSSAIFPASAAFSYPNGTIGYWRDSGGTNQGAMQWTAADQLIFTYAATKQITFRNNTPTNKAILNDTSFTPGSAGGITLGASTVPWSNAFIGTSSTDVTSFTGSTTAARTITRPDGNSTTVLVASLTTTAAASDAVTVTGATSSSHCSVTPTNASAATNIATTFISAKAANTITVSHTATASMTYDLLCTSN